MIRLEGQQAGLSPTVLKRGRTTAPVFISLTRYASQPCRRRMLFRLLQNTLRHHTTSRVKFAAIISNARAPACDGAKTASSPILSGHSLMASCRSPSGQPDEIPTSTPASDALAKALKKTRLQVCLVRLSVTLLCAGVRTGQ
ncbi:DNA-3-methyladenine glycosylase I [Salmonella enterica subsp. enterica]|nr:DNA-3-methyladenine glycosylase I [Salmonella enterica subsp. enterica]